MKDSAIQSNAQIGDSFAQTGVVRTYTTKDDNNLLQAVQTSISE
jgi:hypothetical protein